MTPEFFSHQKFEVELHPGEKCPSCERRIPYPKKSDSPKTKVFSVRIPIDDADVFTELVDAVAEHMSVREKPHHRYTAILLALALALQTPAKELDGA